MIPRSAACSAARSVELERDPPQLLHQRAVADDLRRAVEVDVLVVLADLGLRRRREDRLGQLVGLAQAGRQLDPADRAGRAGTPSSRSRRDSRGRRTRPGTCRACATSSPRPRPRPARPRDEVVRDDLAGLLEPEHGQPGQHLALVGDRGREHDVVGGDTVGGDHQQTVAELVHLPDLAAAVEVQTGQLGGCIGHDPMLTARPSSAGQARSRSVDGRGAARPGGQIARNVRRRGVESTRRSVSSGSCSSSSRNGRCSSQARLRGALDDPVGVVPAQPGTRPVRSGRAG